MEGLNNKFVKLFPSLEMKDDANKQLVNKVIANEIIAMLP